jgi:ketosteroid isomerase-like protein
MIATTTDIMAAQTQSNRKNKMMAQTQSEESKNKEIIHEGFAKWANGTGDVFDLLADDMEWTIIGNNPVSKTYSSRKQFLEEVIAPLNERLSVKIVPRVRGIYADGDMVIALWDGTATAKDGKPYNNTYSWHMTMKNGRIVKVVAFFDTIDLADLWKRIPVSKQDNK